MTDGRAYLIDQYQEAAHEAGLGDVFDHITNGDDNPTSRLLLGILGAVALGLIEMGYEPNTPRTALGAPPAEVG